MESKITREAAVALLKKYNKDPFHLQHALTVEGVMRWYARELGFAEEEEFHLPDKQIRRCLVLAP